MEERLRKAIIRKIGKKELRQIAGHGADYGVPGFTYYRETVGFFKRYKKEIVSLVEELAYDLGETPIGLVMSFRCLDGVSEKEVAQTLYGHKVDEIVANGLTWFALEEVANQEVNY